MGNYTLFLDYLKSKITEQSDIGLLAGDWLSTDNDFEPVTYEHGLDLLGARDACKETIAAYEFAWVDCFGSKKIDIDIKRIILSCSKRLNVSVSGYVYFVFAKSVNRMKIGFSVQPQRRFDTINGSSPVGVRLVHVIETNNMSGLELLLHAYYQDKRARFEWFDLKIKDIEWLLFLDRLDANRAMAYESRFLNLFT